MADNGYFVISLDFELMWGMRDLPNAEEYRENIEGVWSAIPRMLELFDSYGISATFATVGMLFAPDKESLLQYCPTPFPRYDDPGLSPYEGHFDLIEIEETESSLHYATGLIDLIKKYPSQEIGCHTFSHYYCLEKGQTAEDFERDLIAAANIARSRGIELKSLVFPRNQFNDEYLDICRKLGYQSFRGNEDVWFLKAADGVKQNPVTRAFRLIDTYVNVGGHHCIDLDKVSGKAPLNIPSSRFLRPWSRKLACLEKLKEKRVRNSMSFAAENGQAFHLWWHPHNQGAQQDKNFELLENLLKHYQTLRSKHNFESVSMGQLANKIQSLANE